MKEKVIIKHPSEAPQGVKIRRNNNNQLYYEKDPQPRQKTPGEMQKEEEMVKQQRKDALLERATKHYENLLSEYKNSKDVNPQHAMSLQADLQDAREMIQNLHRHYQDELVDKESHDRDSLIEGRNVNINIQKYLGEPDDKQVALKFQNDLNKIFEEEINKILNSTVRFTGSDAKIFTKKVVEDAIWKMQVHSNRHIRELYDQGQVYVGNLVGKSLDFSKVDELAIQAITDRKVLKEAYENMGKQLSSKINDIITESYRDPKTFSMNNMVNKMKESADSETYRLERIVRTETRTASQKGREMGFKKVDPNGTNRYTWAVRHDSRTSGICKEIEELVQKEGNGKGVPLDRLNEILKTVSLKHNGENWEYRDWTPHINCRSGLTRSFAGENN